MEKKSTRIAYFVALGVFIVLLVILGISFKDTPLPTFVYEDETVTAATPFAATFWSLLPPIVAIVLALISKEVLLPVPRLPGRRTALHPVCPLEDDSGARRQ